MSDLKVTEQRLLERVLAMGGGYVLDFSNRTMSEFFDAELTIDIYEERWSLKGDSKANRMRAFWMIADNGTVAKALRSLWDCRLEMSYGDPPTDSDHQRYFQVVSRLEGDPGMPRTDGIDKFSSDETLEELVLPFTATFRQARRAPRWTACTPIA